MRYRHFDSDLTMPHVALLGFIAGGVYRGCQEALKATLGRLWCWGVDRI